MFTSFSKYWKGTVAVLSFLSVIITAFLSEFGTHIPAGWLAAIAGFGTVIGGVLSWMQNPSPLTPEEKAAVDQVRAKNAA
jgi:hypothetical protein